MSKYEIVSYEEQHNRIVQAAAKVEDHLYKNKKRKHSIRGIVAHNKTIKEKKTK